MGSKRSGESLGRGMRERWWLAIIFTFAIAWTFLYVRPHSTMVIETTACMEPSLNPGPSAVNLKQLWSNCWDDVARDYYYPWSKDPLPDSYVKARSTDTRSRP